LVPKVPKVPLVPKVPKVQQDEVLRYRHLMVVWAQQLA
jgi:hypothetical protein